MTDHDTITALARHLASLGIARSEVAAAEAVHTLRARGWRPLSPTEEWQRHHGPPADPQAVRTHAEAARAALNGAIAGHTQGHTRPINPSPDDGDTPGPDNPAHGN